MANKVDVFTEELSKVFTILQQQYVMIKYMKALITSGELDETEISKLKEQITTINNNINTIIDDQIVPIKQDIERIEHGMDEIVKVTPTDINIDSNGSLILEHDGVEITGQKKQVAVYTKEQVNTLLNSAGLKTFKLKNKDDYSYQSGASQSTIIITTTDIPILNDCAEYVQEHGACILEFDYINRNTTYDSPIRILMLYTINGGYGHIVLHGTTGDDEVNASTTRNEGAIADENKIIMNTYAYKFNIKDYKVYRHQLILHATDGEYTTCFLDIYSSNNLKVDSLQDLTTLLKPNANTLYTGVSIVAIGMPNLFLKYENNIWQIGEAGEAGDILNPVTSVEDIVTTI